VEYQSMLSTRYDGRRRKDGAIGLSGRSPRTSITFAWNVSGPIAMGAASMAATNA
jgi:hypothetical protein